MARCTDEDRSKDSLPEDFHTLEIMASEICDHLDDLRYCRDSGDLDSMLAELDSFIDRGRRYLGRARKEVGRS